MRFNKSTFVGKKSSSFFFLFVVLMFGSFVNATHLSQGQVCGGSCPVAGEAGCVCDYNSCHYYCTPRISDVPSQPGPEMQAAVVKAGQNLAYLESLRTGAALTPEQARELVTQENALGTYYEQILSVEPKNFWANWDYATLKTYDGNYVYADHLYHTAVSTLDERTRIEVLTGARLSTVNRLKLAEEPLPEKSSFLKKIGEGIKEALDLRKEETSYDAEKLTWKAKLAKKAGLYNNYEAYNQCVTGGRKVSGCVVDSLVGIQNQ